MSKGFTDWPDLGVFPLQDTEEGVPIGMRMLLAGGRVALRPDAGDGSDSSITEYAREHGLGTLGDIHPWLFWQTKEREKRAMGSWAMAWGGLVTDSASVRYGGAAGVQPLTRRDRDQINDARYRVLEPAWQDVLPWQPEGMLAMVMPSTDETNPGSTMLSGDRRLVAAGASGPGQAGTTICDMQPDGILCMDGSTAPGQGGRHARLHGLVRVIALDQGSAPMLGGVDLNSIALNYGASQQDGILGYGMIYGPAASGGGGPTTGSTRSPGRPTTPNNTVGRGPGGAPPPPGRNNTGSSSGPGGGPAGGDGPEGPNAGIETSVADFGTFQSAPRSGHAVGFMSSAASGPITFGCVKHRVGTDKDGHPMTSAHISTEGYFFRNANNDGPLLFEGDFPDELDEHPNETHVHLSWDKQVNHGFIGGPRSGKWRWWTTVPYFGPTTRTRGREKGPPPITGTPPTPSTPSSPNAPTTPGGSPSAPSAPSTPSTPGSPGTPSKPGAPNAPTTPSFPGSPTAPPPPAQAFTERFDDPLIGLGPGAKPKKGPSTPGNPPVPTAPEDIPKPAKPPGMKPGQAITFPEGTARPFTRFGQDIPTFTDRNTENQRLDIGPTSDLSQELGGPPGVINQVGGSASGRDVGLYSLFHPFNTGFAAIALRPQLWLKGAPNFEHNPLLNSRVYREEERTRPTVLTIRAWGAQNSSGDWDYIESPVSSRARGGNVNGGILIAPAEFEMEDYLGINSQADTDSPAASTYVTFAPTVAVAFGKPATTGRPSASSKIIHQDTAIGKLVVSGITDTAGSTTDILKMSLDADISQGFVEFEGTGAAKLPSGTTAQRPSTVASGMVRMNSTLTALEFYNGSAWVAVGDLTHQARLYGVLQTEGTDPPTLESNGLNIASVSRTAIGKYTFTFDAGLGLTANAYCAKLGAAISTSAQFFVAEILTRTAGVVTIEVRNASTLALADGGDWALTIHANI